MSRAQRLVLLPMVVIAAVLLVSAAVGLARPAMPVRGATHEVSIESFTFMPGTLTIAVGDTVTWTNNDTAPHTATARNGAFDSGNLDTGESFSYTFTRAGDFAYICEIHPQMTASITVQEAAAAATTAATAAATATGVPSTAMEEPAAGVGPLTALGAGLLLAAASALLILRARRAR